MILSPLDIFFKDLSRSLFVFVAIWWYLSPGMYGRVRVPVEYLHLYDLNPFAHIFPAYHDCLLNGKAPVLGPLVLILGVSLVVVVLASIFFNRCRYYFFKYL